MVSARYMAECAVCNSSDNVINDPEMDETVMYCTKCKFAWNTALSDEVLLEFSKGWGESLIGN